VTLRVRAADAVAEAAVLGEADWRAYRMGTATGWDSYFRDNDLLRHPDGVLVVEDGARLAGHAVNHRFELALGGRDVLVFGVAAVGVAPESRRQGVTDRLMRETLRRARRAGVAFAMLHPVAQTLYRRFGYETVEWRDLVRARPGQLPRSPLARRVRRLHLPADGAAIEALYERQRQGRVGPIRRTRYWWDDRLYRRASEWAGVDGPRGLAGYVAWDVPGEPGFPHQHLEVKELVAEDPSAYRALVGLLANLGDQYVRVGLTLPRGQGAALLREHEEVPGQPAPLAVVSSPGVMARLVDLPAAFAAFGRKVPGSLGLDVADPVFPDQHGGRLAQILFAAVPAVQLLEQGLIEGDRAAAARLDAAFAGLPVFLGHANHF
jgi:predicted acetyltransferase